MGRRATLALLVLGAMVLSAVVPPAPVAAEHVVFQPQELPQRYLPRPAGVEKPMKFVFGPFVIPPGQDNNKVTVDPPLHNGFITSIAPYLIDVVSGKEPFDLEMHIHHAHWFRVSDDPADEYYTLNLAWVFGTGEEKTQGSLNDRSAAQPDGPRYGIYIPGSQPQALIFMLHNKLAAAREVYLILDVTFAYGTAADISAAAPDCGPLPLLDGETCAGGQTFHALKGKLWGSTFDVLRDFDPQGDGVYVYPRDLGGAANALGRHYTAPSSGTAIATAGHLHPNGMEVVIANLGPAGSGCEADLDGDGFAGVTLLHSLKLERNPAAFPHSEDYQMGVSQFDWRAPIRAGDRITQFGVYENGITASYQAMSYVGLYVDREQVPEPRVGGCTLENTRPILLNDPLGDATAPAYNHAWWHAPLPLCGIAGMAACNVPVVPKPDGLETSVVHIGGFAYLPGDLNLAGPLGAPPKVKRGDTLRVVNEDAALGIRHSLTSCAWPCNGPYVANYPQPDGLFHSGKLGNFDYIDGGLTGADTVPVWEWRVDVPAGKYSYYCLIHPTMRGALEVVA